MRQFTALVTSASLEGRKQGDVSCGRISPLQCSSHPDSAALATCTPTGSLAWPRTPKPPVKWGKMLSLRPRSTGMWLQYSRGWRSPRARGDPWLWELTGSSCCGNGCNWPEQGGHRIQGPRRRKSVQQHQPKPVRRSNRQAGEQAGGPRGHGRGREVPHGVPTPWCAHSTAQGWGPCWYMPPNHLSCLPVPP